MPGSDDEDSNRKGSKEEGSGQKPLHELGGGEVLVILDLANLETVKTKKGEYQLLNWCVLEKSFAFILCFAFL